ncbi:MAG: CoA pyrophosphatase [Oscillibacter sp.]|nr:CoA pyrophosphatase [Oscillibacter sp.]
MTGALDALRRRYGGHTPGLLGAARSCAVLAPLLETRSGPCLLFETRAAGLRQGGEVCFPGGWMEPGETPEDCALRETEEELSIPREEVDLLGPSDFICNQRGFLLRPVVGVVSPAGLAQMQPSPAEVAEVFTVPLDFFRRTPPVTARYRLIPSLPEDFPYEAAGIPRDYAWSCGAVEVPSWRYEGHVIWGMTARIVKDLMQGL